MGLIPLGILSSAGGSGPLPAYELIDTNILGSNVGSVTFSSLGTYSSTYKHLQLRFAAKYTSPFAGGSGMFVRFNGDSGSNYRWHRFYGSGSGNPISDTSSSTRLDIARISGAASNTYGYGVGVCDILDAYNSSKNTTTRTFSGTFPDNFVFMQSGLWINTASITSIEILPADSQLATGSRFSLYGIKG
jgi:hypothetical protein